MNATTQPTTEQKDIEHLALVALVYATRLQLMKYLNLTKVQQHDKLTYQNAKNALERIEKKLTGSLLNITKDEKEALADSTAIAGICSRKFARVAGLIGNTHQEAFYQVTKEIIKEIIEGIPSQHQDFAALLKEEGDED